MEALRQYVISVVAAAMLCGIVVRLFPNGSGKQVGKLICGLFLAYTVLSPISRVDFSNLPDFPWGAWTTRRMPPPWAKILPGIPWWIS